MANYIVAIGSVFNIEKQINEPAVQMLINQDQFVILNTFANQERDENLNIIYKINNVKFTIIPAMDLSAVENPQTQA